MTLIPCLFHFLLLVTLARSDCQNNIDSPLVFDPVFYLNNNADLESSGLITAQAARDHWCNSGIDEGRQATSSFHIVQYIENYADIQVT